MYYGDVQGFKDYHNGRGNQIDIADFTDVEIEIMLLVGSEWIDAKHRSDFKGLKTGGRSQKREFPRTGHYDFYDYLIPSDETPDEIKNATYELALKHGKNPGSLSKDFTPNQYRQVSVDGAVSATYVNYSDVSEIQTNFSIVNDIMSNLIGGSQSSSLSGERTIS